MHNAQEDPPVLLCASSSLPHVSESSDVMFWQYTGQVSLSDDKRAMCAIYPPRRPGSGTCDDLPRHGFSPECADAQPELTCPASPLVARPGASAALLLVMLIGLTLPLRRRDRRAARRS